MKSIYLSLTIILAAVTAESQAAEKPKGPLTWQKIAAAASLNHPTMQALRLKRKELSGEEVKASALPNPEADSKVLYNFDQSHIEGEVTITQKLELGGKRRARINEARSDTRRYLLTLKIKENTITGETILLSNRLGQIQKEFKMLRETQRTMKNLMARYRRFPRLTPEMQVSRSVYQLVLQDTERNQELLAAERDTITGRLSRWTGYKEETIRAASFPDFKKLSDPGENLKVKSPLLGLLHENTSGAKASLDAASALAVPDIALGPSFSGSGYKSTREIAAGFSVSMAIPVFNQNTGGIKIAGSRYRQTKKIQHIERQRLVSLRADMLKRYRNLFAATRRDKKNHHDRDHQLLHLNMSRGKVSPSLIIEFHRQNLESLKSSHALKQEALKLLMAIRSLDGTVHKELTHE